jgi:hypothetical protein
MQFGNVLNEPESEFMASEEAGGVAAPRCLTLKIGQKYFSYRGRLTHLTNPDLKVLPSSGTGTNYPCAKTSMWLIVNRFETDP